MLKSRDTYHKNYKIPIGTLKIMWIYLCFITLSKAAPKERLTQAGPCIGMDCLHGVLMHADDKQGDDHKAEDAYERLQRQDKLKQDADKSGPCEGSDCLHKLLHNENDGDVKHMEQKMGPEPLIKKGPEHVMDYMHGVLMHGDEEPGRTHKVEDENLKKVEKDHDPDGPCIDCLEKRLHSTHLERDTEDETEIPSRPQYGTLDPDSLLHSEGEGHGDSTHSGDSDVSTELGKDSVLDPDSLLHEDRSDHSIKQDSDSGDEIYPKSGAFDPDNLLHGDSEAHIKGDEDTEKKTYPKSGTYDLESALHGEDASFIHDSGNTQRQEIKGVKPGTYDPDAFLHEGDEDVHDDKRASDEVELGKVKDKHEHDDFKMWMKDKLNKKEATKNKDGSLGFSKPFISDSIMDDIDKMKQRYLSEYNGEEAVQTYSTNNQGEGDTSSEEEDEWEWEEFEEDIDAEQDEAEEEEEELGDWEPDDNYEDQLQDLKQEVSKEEDASKKINVHDLKSRHSAESLEHIEDMRHELENIGSTKSFRTDADLLFDKKETHKRTHHERDRGL